MLTTHALNSLIPILILALVHVFAKELHRIEATRRNALLSAGVGASIAYVLLGILPKLAEKQESLTSGVDTGVRGFLEHHIYIVAMIGLVLYYGISRIAVYEEAGESSQFPLRRRLAMISTVIAYAAYSLLIGYLITERHRFGLFSTTLITLGMGALFLVSDHSLQKKWPLAYDRRIRWILTVSLLSGWVLAILHEASPNVVALWYALLAGMMLITNIGEKMSLEQGGSYLAFLLGVAAFTAMLLTLEQLPSTVL